MTVSASTDSAPTEHAARNQQMVMLVLVMAAVRALVRNRVAVLLGAVAVGRITQTKSAAARSALRRRMATNLAAWRHH